MTKPRARTWDPFEAHRHIQRHHRRSGRDRGYATVIESPHGPV
jgi:hypothetical protein